MHPEADVGRRSDLMLRAEQLIYRIQHGSHLYGTNTENSDFDYKEVYIPSGSSILLNRIKEGRQAGPDKSQSPGVKNQPGDVDVQSFAITKLFRMLTQGDIIGCELIFTPEQNVIYKHPWYDEVLERKSIFLSSKVSGYVGYCRQQANKYGIRGSRISACRAVIELLKSKPHLSKTGEWWNALTILAGETEHCAMVKQTNGMGQEEELFECCGKKIMSTITVKEATLIYQRYFDDYGHRALLAEKNEGIDWKAISHALRVGRQAIELLETHQITFPRPDAEELLSVKRGERPYAEVSSQLDELLTRVLEASKTSTLPSEADFAAIDELTIDLHRRQIR